MWIMLKWPFSSKIVEKNWLRKKFYQERLWYDGYVYVDFGGSWHSTVIRNFFGYIESYSEYCKLSSLLRKSITRPDRHAIASSRGRSSRFETFLPPDKSSSTPLCFICMPFAADAFLVTRKRCCSGMGWDRVLPKLMNFCPRRKRNNPLFLQFSPSNLCSRY